MTSRADQLLEQYPFPAVIDNTMVQDWLRCPHYFFRAHVQGLRKKDPGAPGEDQAQAVQSIHLHFGGALARGLEVTRKEWVRGGNEEAALISGAEALMKAWGDSPLPAPTNRNEENKTLQNCLHAHLGYFREWPLDDPQHAVAVRGGEPLVEFSGALPIPGIRHPVSGEPLLYAGRFDAMCDRNYSSLWGLDDKSTGSNVDSANWRNQWTLSGQFSGYCWLAEAWGHRLDGFLVHGIQVLKDSTKYAEAITPRPKWQVQAWLEQLQENAQKMVEQYERFLVQRGTENPALVPHSFGRAYGSACHAYNHPCVYQDDLCAQPNPEDWIDQFIVQRWDPLQRGVDQ